MNQKKPLGFKNLILLIIAFIIGLSALITSNALYTSYSDKLDYQIRNEESRSLIGEYIINQINSIEAEFYRIALSKDPVLTGVITDSIKSELSDIKEAFYILRNGGLLTYSYTLNLAQEEVVNESISYNPLSSEKFLIEEIDLEPKIIDLEKKIDQLEELIIQYNYAFELNEVQKIEQIEKELDLFFKKAPSLFIRMKENANRLMYEGNEKVELHRQSIVEQKKLYITLQTIISLVMLFLISVFGYLTWRQISKSNKKLVELAIESQEANKAKTVFLANMSHEIRTPMNSIIGFSELLNENKLDDKSKEYSQIIYNNAKSLLEIINDILDLSKIESNKLELSTDEYDIRLLQEQVVSMFMLAAKEKTINLSYSIDDDVPEILAFDFTRLRQVLVNLLSNAIKFTQIKGSVSFDIKLIKKQQQSVILDFSIRDNGIGIDEQTKEILFQPFTQADSSITRKYGGTGLGLAISYKILEAMGSSLLLDSILNKGSRFHFELNLPIAISDANEKNNVIIDQKIDLNTKNGFNVLVAEDNPTNSMLMKIMLETLGYECVCAQNGLEAFDLFKVHENISLILMDINMPIMDGITSTIEIRKFINENDLIYVPIIALTANAMKGESERIKGLGFDDYITKPIEINKLKLVLESYLINFKITEFIYNKQNILTKMQVDSSTLDMLMDNFFFNLEGDLEKINFAAENNDLEKLENYIHYLLGSCKNLYLDCAVGILLELELELKNGLIRFDLINKLYICFEKIKEYFDLETL
jgi:signal transduction histidine kinase/CheY-like chemotaxis protein